MVQHTCEICSKVFTKRNQYTNHKKRKTPCLPIAKLAQNIHTPTTDNATPEEVFGVQHEPKRFDGTIVWKKTDDSVADDNVVRANSDKMTTLMKRCHQILYNNGGIVGNHALKDIMKILMLKMLQPFLTDKNSTLYQKVQQTMSMIHSKEEEKFLELFETAKNIRMLMEKSYGDSTDRWKVLVDRFLSRILPQLYEKSDYLNCRSDVALIDLILHIDKLDDVFITNAEKSGYDTICGQIYENFINGYMKGDKVLGQMFTPRNLVHLILDGMLKDILKDKKDMIIYDPCMGSGGFLCLTKRMMGDKVVKMVGSDIGKDPFSFAFFNVLMTTGRLPENLYFEDTLKCYRPEKADLIITNPPFALKVRYQQKNKDDNMSNGVKDMYDCFRGNRDDIPKFEEVYPFNTNSGVCLFIQHCIHKLKDGGICAIVLPDGEVMTGGRGMANFRHWFCRNANIRYIVSVPSGVFEHVGVRTAVIVFEKSDPTSSITFMRTNGVCDEIIKVCDVSVEHMGRKKYIFDPSVYLKGEEQNEYSDGVVVKTLGELCNLETGTFNSKDCRGTGPYPFYKGTANNPAGFHDAFCFDHDDEYIILIKDGGAGDKKYGDNIGLGKVFLAQGKTASTTHQLALSVKNTSVIMPRFLYHFMGIIKNKIMDMARYTTGLGCIRKSELVEIKIPVPDMDTQQEIVADCDQLCTQIQTLKTLEEQIKTEKNIFFKYSIKRTFLRSMPASPMKTLGELCNLETGTFNSKDCRGTGPYPFYKGTANNPAGFHDAFCFDHDDEYIILIKDGGAGDKKYGDNIGLGKVFLAQGKTASTTHQLALSVKNTSVIMPRFLYHFMGIIKNKIMDMARYTTGLGCIRKSELVEIKIPVPDMDTQRQWIQRFVEHSSKLNEYDDELSKLDTKIKSLESMMVSCFE